MMEPQKCFGLWTPGISAASLEHGAVDSLTGLVPARPSFTWTVRNFEPKAILCIVSSFAKNFCGRLGDKTLVFSAPPASNAGDWRIRRFDASGTLFVLKKESTSLLV